MMTVAKGLTSAYAPMGAVLVSDKVAEPLYAPGTTLLHGITFGGHPVAAAIALMNLEIFEREGSSRTCDRSRPGSGGSSRRSCSTSRSSWTSAGAASSGRSSWLRGDPAQRFDADQRERLLRGFLPRRLREAGLIARADDRGDAVLQIAPPLISDREQLDQMIASLGEVLADAGKFMGL